MRQGLGNHAISIVRDRFYGMADGRLLHRQAFKDKSIRFGNREKNTVFFDSLSDIMI